MSNFFVCYVHNTSFPISMRHVHHVIPQSLGGADDASNLKSLCHTCHSSLHLIAYMFANTKRRHEIQPTAITIFPTDHRARQLLLELSAKVATEMALKKERKRDDDEEVLISVSLPVRYRELLKLFGHQRPNSNGTPRGLSRAIRNIVADELSRQFPYCRAQIDSLRAEKKSSK